MGYKKLIESAVEKDNDFCMEVKIKKQKKLKEKLERTFNNCKEYYDIFKRNNERKQKINKEVSVHTYNDIINEKYGMDHEKGIDKNLCVRCEKEIVLEMKEDRDYVMCSNCQTKCCIYCMEDCNEYDLNDIEENYFNSVKKVIDDKFKEDEWYKKQYEYYKGLVLAEKVKKFPCCGG